LPPRYAILHSSFFTCPTAALCRDGRERPLRRAGRRGRGCINKSGRAAEAAPVRQVQQRVGEKDERPEPAPMRSSTAEEIAVMTPAKAGLLPLATVDLRAKLREGKARRRGLAQGPPRLGHRRRPRAEDITCRAGGGCGVPALAPARAARVV